MKRFDILRTTTEQFELFSLLFLKIIRKNWVGKETCKIFWEGNPGSHAIIHPKIL